MGAQLQNELKRLLAVENSPTKLAREAKIAPKTLQQIQDGSFAKSKDSGSDKDDARQKRLWTEALTRITLFVAQRSGRPISVEEVLVDYGLDPEDPYVKAAMERIKVGELREVGLTDAVLTRIQNRAREAQSRGVHGIVHYGVLEWEPFHANRRDDSWGHQFCDRFLGTLNPCEWRIEPHTLRTISETLDAVGGDGSTVDIDLAFGAYSTVSRQLRGLHFIPVPGIGIPLDALYYCPKEMKGVRVGWDDIARRETHDRKRFDAKVLKDEVGELYLRGPCGYDPEEIDTLDGLSPSEIAELLTEMRPRSNRISLFVADRPTCFQVKAELESIAKRKTARAEIAQNYLIMPASARERAAPPVYRLGMAIRANAEKWRQLLENAIVEELFRNDRAWTARHYAEIFSRAFDRLSLVPLEPQLPAPIARSFAKEFWRLCQSGIVELDSEPGKRLKRELEEHWGVEFEPSTLDEQ